MTAASVFCGPSAAYLLTDAASFADDGTIVQIASKVAASNRLRVALAMSGPSCIEVTEGNHSYSPLNDVRKLLDESADQREFLLELPRLMRTIYSIMSQRGGGWFQFVIALWSQAARRSEGHVCGTPGHSFPGGLPPFRLAAVDPAVMPAVDRALWPHGELTRDRAIEIIESQRESQDERWGWKHLAGGFAELTAVSVRGVHTQEIIRWSEDRVGEAVDPFMPAWKRHLRAFGWR